MYYINLSVIFSHFLFVNGYDVELPMYGNLKVEIIRTVVVIVQVNPEIKDIIMLCYIMQIDDWRDIALPRDLVKKQRVRTLGANSSVTGFGNEFEALGSNGYA